MAALLPWLEANWFSFLQSVGIVGGLLFTAASVRRDTKARRINDMLKLKEEHRELWSELHRRSDLARITTTKVDLIGTPVTPVEEMFLNIAIVHFHTGWQMNKMGVVIARKGAEADIKWFFNLPIAHAVWEASKNYREPEFVKFVEKCLRE